VIVAKPHFSYKYHSTVKKRGGGNLEAWGQRKIEKKKGTLKNPSSLQPPPLKPRKAAAPPLF